MKISKEQLAAIPENIKLSGHFEEREVMVNDEPLSPRHSQGIYNHSPDGFNWSYGGSGPAQLSLAILMLYLPVREATSLHQLFKWNIIAALPKSDFEITIPLRNVIKMIADE